MTVKDLIWELEQIYNKNKQVTFGTSSEDEVYLHEIHEFEFSVRITE